MALDDNFGESERGYTQNGEGLFDAQLTFPDPSVAAPRSVGTLIKRDGRSEPFDKGKVADGIRRASLDAGDTAHDRAAALASAVSIYLSKSLSRDAATSQQVAEAVERVLVEMGHVRAAQCFATFRERRLRLRRLRSRETVSNQLASARQEPETRSGGLLVRTSTERLAEWNRDKIAEALVRETGLERGIAQRMALEVERQISAAGVTTLTTPLVREMVNAKLIEHGFEEHARRHMRLGVPLYDVDRIVSGLNADGVALDPEMTGRVLAESIKREFALSQVFGPDIADAHLAGDIHLHHLAFIDRLYSVRSSVGAVARLGLGSRVLNAFARPPKSADALLAQMVSMGTALTNHFSGGVDWDMTNLHFAPFLEGVGSAAIRRHAQMLVCEFACRAATFGEHAGRSGIVLCWEPPAHLKLAEAVGPEGAPTGRTYGDYAYSAQQFAMAIVDVLRDTAKRGTIFPAPLPVIRVTPASFRMEGYDSFLEHVTDAVASGLCVRFVFDRENLLTDGAEPWVARDLIVHKTTLNLPRAAARARDWPHLSKELGRLVEIAARAHGQKRDLIERLFALRDLGPLSLLCVQCEGRPVFDLHRAAYVMGVTGLDECVYLLTGQRLVASKEAVMAGERILEEIALHCREWSSRLDLFLVPGPIRNADVASRFAVLDSDAYPDAAAAVLAAGPDEGEAAYTPGVSPSPNADITPIERARIEGAFHEMAPGNAVTTVRLPHADASGRSILDFVRKVYRQTTCRQLVLSS